MFNFKDDYELIKDNAVNATVEYLKDNNLKVVVLGVSGGIDSGLVTALMHEAKQKMDIRIIGMVLDVESKKTELDRGVAVAQAFCDETIVKSLTNTFRVLAEDLMMHESDEHSTRVRKGNLKARIRMLQLYDVARAKGGMVLSTDNFTELLLGFWTLHGDVGDFGIIQNLWKTEVYGLAKYLVDNYEEGFRGKAALQLAIDALPTDGLGVSNSDFGQIAPELDETAVPRDNYHEVDKILLEYLHTAANEVPANIDTAIVQRHLRTEYKRNNPVNLERITLIRRRT